MVRSRFACVDGPFFPSETRGSSVDGRSTGVGSPASMVIVFARAKPWGVASTEDGPEQVRPLRCTASVALEVFDE